MRLLAISGASGIFEDRQTSHYSGVDKLYKIDGRAIKILNCSPLALRRRSLIATARTVLGQCEST